MERQSALVLVIIFFVLFGTITYYGARVTLWSSIIFSIFVSLLLLNIFYPPRSVATDNPDFTLVVYGLLQGVGLIILAIYIIEKTLSDVRLPVKN